MISKNTTKQPLTNHHIPSLELKTDILLRDGGKKRKRKENLLYTSIDSDGHGDQKTRQKEIF